jgi:hypothetical protein
VIGDREYHDNEPETEEDLGPLDAMVRMDAPEPENNMPRLPPAWVERYGRFVLVRHTFPAGDSSTVTPYPSDGQAVRFMAVQVAALLGRGYRLVAGDGLPPVP